MKALVVYESMFGNTEEVATRRSGRSSLAWLSREGRRQSHHETRLLFAGKANELPLLAGEKERARLWGTRWAPRPRDSARSSNGENSLPALSQGAYGMVTTAEPDSRPDARSASARSTESKP